MVQTIRPISTISSGSWTAEGDATLHEVTDETSQDGDTTRAEAASGAGTFEVKLATGIDPASSANHTIHAWGKGVGSGGGEKVDVFLFEGTTEIAQLANNWTPGRSAYAEGVWTISAAEADNISDYSDLRVRIVEDTIGGGSERFNVTQIYMEIPDIPTVLTQSNFRIKTGDSVGLNVDSGWAAAINVNADIDTEKVFRIRFEVGSDGADTDGYKIQENYATAGWFDMVAPGLNPPGPTGVIRTSFAPSSQYADGDPTTDVLSGEGGSFIAGSGEESNNTASVALAAGEHTEFEFSLIIRKLFGDDGAGNEWGFTADGDTVQYRLVKDDGTVLSYSNTPTITVRHPTRLIGGTFAETPGRVLVAEDTGVLYALVEHAQLPTPIVPSMLKSTDGGDSWVPQDDADWVSTTIELEAADMHYVAADDKIYMGMTSSTDPDYREFQTSGHGTPDAYTAASVEVTAVVDKTEQVMAIARRSDGTVVMFYNELATNGKMRYKIRSSGGTWGSQLDLETEVGTDWSSCQIVLGAGDLIHIIYSGDAAGDPIYYRNLTVGNSLSGRTSLTTDTDSVSHSPFVKPVYWDDGGTEKIYLIYRRLTDDKLYSRIVTDGSVGSEVGPITTNAVLTNRAGSGMPTAQAVVDGKDVYVVYAHETDLDLYLTKSINGGTFDTDAEILDGVTAGLLSAESFTHNGGNGGAKVIGIIYDDERWGEGNTGGTVYFEYEISTGGTDVLDSQPAYLKGQDTALDNQSAYLKGEDNKIDAQPAYLAGIDTTLAAQDAYLAGIDTDLDSQPAYLGGVDTNLDSQSAYLAGQINITDSQDAYLAGVDTDLDFQPAYLLGGIVSIDAQPAYLNGVDTDIDSQPAYLLGGVAVTNAQLAYLNGIAGDLDSQSAYLAGVDTDLDSQPAYLAGIDTDLDAQDAYLLGGVVSTDAQSAFLAGIDTDLASQPAYLAGHDVTLGGQPAYLVGQDSALDSAPAFLVGGLIVIDPQPAYLAGVAGSIDSKQVYLAGIDTDLDVQPAYLAGVDTDLDAQPAYLYGEINVLDSASGYLAGHDTGLSSIPAFLVGGIEVSDNIQAYMDGDAQIALDNQVAYLAGIDTILDDQGAYLAGIDTTLASQPSYLSGQNTTLTSTHGSLTGQDTDLDSQPAYLLGGVEVNDSQPAYADGIAPVISSTPAYLYGQVDIIASQSAYLAGDDNALDSQSVYLLGDVVIIDSTPAFLQGQDSTLDNQGAYLAGRGITLQGQPAYLSGVDTALDSQEAFTAGGIEDLDSQPSYLAGVGTALSSQSVYLTGNIVGGVTSAQSVYMTGQDTSKANSPAYMFGKGFISLAGKHEYVYNLIAEQITSVNLVGSEVHEIELTGRI